MRVFEATFGTATRIPDAEDCRDLLATAVFTQFIEGSEIPGLHRPCRFQQRHQLTRQYSSPDRIHGEIV
jgi:hypothetical protein